MGIRYFAISIDNEDYLSISAGPCPTCGARPHTRERDYDEPEPDTLDLDKAWGYLQLILDSAGLEGAAELVAGSVTHTPTGWISHQGLVAPDRMRVVADELGHVTPDYVRERFQADGKWRDDRSEQDFEIACWALTAAANFARKVADANNGVVYYIG